MIQQNPQSGIYKKKVEVISTGNSKVFESELSPERHKYYLELREKVYEFNKKITISKHIKGPPEDE
jgi:hypothetical protein